jgi:HK97 family phage major capsid protein
VTDLTPIDISTAESLQKTLERQRSAIIEARTEAGQVLKASNDFTVKYGEDRAKIEEMKSQFADFIGRVNKLEGALPEHEKALDRLHADLSAARNGVSKKDPSRRLMKHAAVAYEVKDSFTNKDESKQYFRRDPDSLSKAAVDEYAAFETGFEKYLRRQTNADMMQHYMTDAEQKSMNTFNSGGGHFLSTTMSNRIIECGQRETSLKDLVSEITISNAAVEMFTRHIPTQGAKFKCETDCNPKSGPQEPLMGTVNIVTNEMYAEACASHTLLEDSIIDVQKLIADQAYEQFEITENRSILNGSGQLQPFGLALNGNHITRKSGKDRPASGKPNITWQDLWLMSQIGLNAKYRANSSWLFNREALGETMIMRDEQNRPIWTNQIIDGKGMLTIANRPFREVVQMAPYLDAKGDPIIGSKPVALGDWKEAYLWVTRRGFTMFRNPFSKHRCGVEYMFTARVGGDVLCNNASTFLEVT